ASLPCVKRLPGGEQTVRMQMGVQQGACPARRSAEIEGDQRLPVQLQILQYMSYEHRGRLLDIITSRMEKWVQGKYRPFLEINARTAPWDHCAESSRSRRRERFPWIESDRRSSRR